MGSLVKDFLLRRRMRRRSGIGAGCSIRPFQSGVIRQSAFPLIAHLVGSAALFLPDSVSDGSGCQHAHSNQTPFRPSLGSSILFDRSEKRNIKRCCYTFRIEQHAWEWIVIIWDLRDQQVQICIYYLFAWSMSVCRSAEQQPEDCLTWGFCQSLLMTMKQNVLLQCIPLVRHFKLRWFKVKSVMQKWSLVRSSHL